MRKLSSVLLAAAVLGAAHEVESGDSTEKGSAASADCLADFNAARERAGLEAFIAETDASKKLPTDKKEYIAAICSAIEKASCRICLAISGAASDVTVPDAEREGTYAYAKPTPQDGATVDCAYITCPISTTTTTTTPTTTSDTTASTELPTSPNDGGGAGLFNAEPKDAGSASLDVQGQASAAAPISSPVSGDEESEDPQRAGPSVRRLSTPSETVTALVCLTNPAALVEGKKPFSEDVWANIKEAIENSASTSSQSALLATALLLFTSFIVL
ncbi:SAG family member [Eimeria mitis]|uniref:SAG family member n=1 Tax=Eimeria mitis TaxID=44415 RepID=U6JVU4_9EIME|nr:SAG family member [Eimeria mitis]CDJ29529.1 SAG family member [Eimeria mitis]